MTSTNIIKRTALLLVLASAHVAYAQEANRDSSGLSPVELVDLFMGVRGNSN